MMRQVHPFLDNRALIGRAWIEDSCYFPSDLSLFHLLYSPIPGSSFATILAEAAASWHIFDEAAVGAPIQNRQAQSFRA